MVLRKQFVFLALLLVAFVPATSALAQAAHPEMIVSTEWLAAHLNDPKVVVLHVASKRSDYDAGHIPGARFLDTNDFIDRNSPLNTELPSPEQLKDVFEKLGVSDNTRIIIYTTAWYPAAGRAYFTLDYMGHGNHTALLNGSMQRWRSENRSVSTEPVAASRGSLTLHVHPEVRAMLDAVKKVSQSSAGAVLVDSRPESRYKDGHIAGSAHLFWEDTVVNGSKDPTLLPPAKLKEMLASRGIKPDQQLITYCEVGLQASHTYFIAKYLGYNAAMFDGSIHQWSHVEMLTVVPGTSSRCPGGGNACEIHEKMQ